MNHKFDNIHRFHKNVKIEKDDHFEHWILDREKLCYNFSKITYKRGTEALHKIISENSKEQALDRIFIKECQKCHNKFQANSGSQIRCENCYYVTTQCKQCSKNITTVWYHEKHFCCKNHQAIWAIRNTDSKNWIIAGRNSRTAETFKKISDWNKQDYTNHPERKLIAKYCLNSKDAQDRAKKTTFERYGVENIGLYAKYIEYDSSLNGKIKLQGSYEIRFAKILDKWYQERKILNWIKIQRSDIKYLGLDNKKHKYFPDFEITYLNGSKILVDTKNDYKLNLISEQHKIQEVINQGYPLQIVTIRDLEKLETTNNLL
jgi:hypothetical protein